MRHRVRDSRFPHLRRICLQPDESSTTDPPAPSLGLFHAIIDEILKADEQNTPKQRHTRAHIFRRLRGEHDYRGGYDAVPAIQSFRGPRRSVERLLAKVHPILMLPLRTADPRDSWLDKKRIFSHSGAPAHAVLSRQTDCLFFIETANEPSKRRGYHGQ